MRRVQVQCLDTLQVSEISKAAETRAEAWSQQQLLLQQQQKVVRSKLLTGLLPEVPNRARRRVWVEDIGRKRLRVKRHLRGSSCNSSRRAPLLRRRPEQLQLRRRREGLRVRNRTASR